MLGVQCAMHLLRSAHIAICRQCSSGLQAVADVASAIKAGYYTIGVAAGVESMTLNPMDWKAGINPRLAEHQHAASCMLPMGASP